MALPADLVHLLVFRVGLAERDVAAMSRDEAIARLQRHWTEGHSGLGGTARMRVARRPMRTL